MGNFFGDLDGSRKFFDCGPKLGVLCRLVLNDIALYCIEFYGISSHCIISYGIVRYCIIGFGARAVSRDTYLLYTDNDNGNIQMLDF